MPPVTSSTIPPLVPAAPFFSGASHFEEEASEALRPNRVANFAADIFHGTQVQGNSSNRAFAALEEALDPASAIATALIFFGAFIVEAITDGFNIILA